MTDVPYNAIMAIDDDIKLDARDPRSMIALFTAFGLNFVVRSSEPVQTLFSAISRALSGTIAPASGLHFACGPSEARVIMQVLELPNGDVLFAASCTAENITTQDTAWLLRNLVEPLQSVAEREGRAFDFMPAPLFDTHEIKDLMARGRVVPIMELNEREPA